MLREFIDDFRKFLRDPQQVVDEPQSRPFRTWLVVLAIDIVIALGIIYPLVHLIDTYAIPLRQVPELSEPLTLWALIGLIVVFAPVVEEIIFRYPLKFARKRILKILIYASSIGFGFYHLTNYANNEFLFFALSPIIIGSQVIGGFFFAYLRLKHGLRWSILAHAVFNGLIVIPAALFWQGKTIIDEQHSDYSLVVKEFSYLERPNRIRIHQENGRVASIKVRQKGLQTVLDSIASPDSLYTNNALVDIDFSTVSPITPDSLLNLLRAEYRIIELKR